MAITTEGFLEEAIESCSTRTQSQLCAAAPVHLLFSVQISFLLLSSSLSPYEKPKLK